MQINSGNIYDSSRRPHPLVEEIISLIKYRDLVYQFVSRSIKTRYKRSVLGVFWTMLNPLFMMIILTIVFSNVFKVGRNYPIFVLSGLVLWNFFSFATSSAMGEMIWSGALLNRIFMPKSVFAVSAIGTGLVNLLISLVPLFLISIILGGKFTYALLVLPLSIIVLALFTLGVGLFLATTAVYFADMVPVYEVVLTIWFYATPIIYPIENIPPHYAWILKLNPMYYIVRIFRLPIYEGVLPGLPDWIIALGCALVAVILGGLIFTNKSKEYAYRI